MSPVSKLKLYYLPMSNSLFARIVLEQGGFENVEYSKLTQKEDGTIYLEDGSKYTDVNPKGWIPTLVVNDKDVLTEAVIIAQYLVSLRPEKYYFPQEGLAKFQAMALLNFLTTEIQKGIMVAKKPFADEKVRNWVADDIAKRYQYLEDILSKQDFLLGDQFSIADAYAYNTTRWVGLCGLDINRFPKMVNWQKRIEKLDFVQRAIKNEGLDPLY